MKEEKFTSLEELYRRLLPALKTKKNEMAREKMKFITVQEIWVYMCKHKWSGKNNLTLADMVDDILNTEGFLIFTESRKDEKDGTNNGK